VNEGLDLTDEDLKRIFSLDFLILLGEEDVVRDAYFLKTKAAMRQGFNRLQRGKQFYSIAQKEAQGTSYPFSIRKSNVSGIPISNGILMKRSSPITVRNTYCGPRLSQITPAANADPAESKSLKNRMIPSHLPICSAGTSSNVIAPVTVPLIK
jgi:hypothetical protein